MSVSSIGSGNAYAYLQSILQQQQSANGPNGAADNADPLSTLLSAFYPGGANSATGSASASGDTASSTGMGSSAGAGCAQFSPDTMGALIAMQGQQSWTDRVSAHAQSIFTQLDTNGDGGVSKSEFEAAFGPNADMSKVDGLFNALDTNGDGSVSQGELTSAAEAGRGMHHHHHARGADSGQNPLDMLTSGADGATSQTTTNTDGSTSTTITYADGSTVTMNVPASSNTSSNTGSAPQNPGGNNVIEQLIRLQAQLLAQSASRIPAPLPAI